MKKETIRSRGGKFKGGSALDFFLNFLVYAAVAWLALAVGTIIFQLIKQVPDCPLPNVPGMDYYVQMKLKSGLAGAIILLPIMGVAYGALHRQYREAELKPRAASAIGSPT